MPREGGVESFLVQHVQRLAQSPDEVLGRSAEELHVERFAVHASLPVPVPAAHAGSAAALQRARAHRGERESGRGHQSLLRPGHRHVDAPVIHPEIDGAERCDHVGHQQGGVTAGVEGPAHRRDVARHRGRGIGMHREHRLDAMAPVRAQPILDAVRIECASPVTGELLGLRAEVVRELAPGLGEHAGGRRQHEIAFPDEVRQGRFPRAVAVGGVEEYPAGGPEHPGEVVEARLGDGHEVGVDQVDGGSVHRGEHPVGDVGGPRRHQEVAAAHRLHVVVHGDGFECGGRRTVRLRDRGVADGRTEGIISTTRQAPDRSAGNAAPRLRHFPAAHRRGLVATTRRRGRQRALTTSRCRGGRDGRGRRRGSTPPRRRTRAPPGRASQAGARRVLRTRRRTAPP